MYTQCTHCHTWFGISAEHLRQAHGTVRCGGCYESFDALSSLRNDLPEGISEGEKPSAPPHAAAPTDAVAPPTPAAPSASSGVISNEAAGERATAAVPSSVPNNDADNGPNDLGTDGQDPEPEANEAADPASYSPGLDAALLPWGIPTPSTQAPTQAPTQAGPPVPPPSGTTRPATGSPQWALLDSTPETPPTPATLGSPPGSPSGSPPGSLGSPGSRADRHSDSASGRDLSAGPTAGEDTSPNTPAPSDPRPPPSTSSDRHGATAMGSGIDSGMDSGTGSGTELGDRQRNNAATSSAPTSPPIGDLSTLRPDGDPRDSLTGGKPRALNTESIRPSPVNSWDKLEPSLDADGLGQASAPSAAQSTPQPQVGGSADASESDPLSLEDRVEAARLQREALVYPPRRRTTGPMQRARTTQPDSTPPSKATERPATTVSADHERISEPAGSPPQSPELAPTKSSKVPTNVSEDPPVEELWVDGFDDDEVGAGTQGWVEDPTLVGDQLIGETPERIAHRAPASQSDGQAESNDASVPPRAASTSSLGTPQPAPDRRASGPPTATTSSGDIMQAGDDEARMDELRHDEALDQPMVSGGRLTGESTSGHSILAGATFAQNRGNDAHDDADDDEHYRDDALDDDDARVERPGGDLKSESAPIDDDERRLDSDPQGGLSPEHGPHHDDASLPPMAATPLPSVLRDDFDRLDKAKKTRRRSGLYSFISLALIGILVAQYAWFLPDDLVRRYPQARAWVDSFCENTGCTLARPRVPSKIQLASRDVRVHPEYEGALLITAQLVNEAGYPQPFPLVVFTLYNVNGQSIATREFAPREYLDASTRTDGDMEPDQPVQIILELLAPEEAAVSFEFRFR